MNSLPGTLITLKRAALLAPLVFGLGACHHMPYHGSEPSNAPQLAAQFIKPVDGQVAIVVGSDGEVSVIDRNGQVVPECSLPGVPAAEGQKPRQFDDGLPICRGSRNTDINKITPLSVTNHTGSNCITISGVSSGRAWQRTFCY